jgi:hypothetical protein
MRISGFTMVKNGDRLYYPVAASIRSILPIVDEFVVALGDCDDGDGTRAAIESIGDEKIRIIDTVWDLEKYPNGTENAHQTDIAKEHCSGDWLFYLQADEVVHEKDLDEIYARCAQLKDDEQVEGLLFDYIHFWGDYDHYQHGHGWYKEEIRIVRNHPEIHSWRSAQSFRRIPAFDGKDYRQKEGTYKLKVARVKAHILHYGWVRPPHLMMDKKKSLDTIHKGAQDVAELYKEASRHFDYGPLGQLARYTDTHPAVMKEWIEKMDWQDYLNQGTEDDRPKGERGPQDRWKNRFLTWVEQKIFGGRPLGGSRNYILLKR